jgi:hypothetical protein
MIREYFFKSIKSLEVASTYLPSETSELIKLCKKVSLNHSTTEIQTMFELCCRIVHAIPDYEYQHHIDIVYNLGSAFVELGKKYDRISNYLKENELIFKEGITLKKIVNFSDPHTSAIGLYINLAARLEDIGIPGEAFNAALKSMDPWVKLYNRFTKEGDTKLKNTIVFDKLLISQMIFKDTKARETVIGRAAIFFRLYRVLGDINNDSLDTFNSYKIYTKSDNLAEFEDIIFYTSYLDLISLKEEKDSNFDEIVIYLTAQYQTEELRGNINNCFIISSSLAKALVSPKWCLKAISNKPTSPYWGDYIYINAYLVILTNDSDFSKLIELTNEFLNRGANFYRDKMMFNLFKQKHSEFINMILLYCLKKDEIQLALHLLYSWLVGEFVNISTILDKSIIVCMYNLGPNQSHFLISHKGEIVITGGASETTLSDIYSLKDKIDFGWTVFLNKEKLIPTTTGRSQVELSNDYIKTIANFINSKELTHILAEYEDNTHFEYIESSWTNTPIVPILYNNTSHSYSISSGVPNKLPVRKVRKALIWGGGALQYSEEEVEAIITIFSKYGIEYEVFDGVACNKTLFMEKYSDCSFDLIWIITHGEFNSDNPPYSCLQISEEEFITSWELQKLIPIYKEKRTVVLNACESGNAGVRYNSMGFLGIGPSISNEYQMILGHLWIVESLAAAILGTLTLNSYLEGNKLSNALKLASKIMRGGNDFIIDNLRGIDPNMNLTERVKNQITRDFSLPFYSMSGVVYE